MYWPALVPALLTVLFNGWVFLVRPARKRRHRSGGRQPTGRELQQAKEILERREPRDTSRPYPKPDEIAGDDERLAVCPVCGMEDPAFLDGELMGWPAHSLCAEWLGEWRAPGAAQLESVPLKSKVAGGCNDRPLRMLAVPGTVREIEIVAAGMLNDGAISVDQFREGMARLQAEMIKSYAVPEPVIIGGAACDCGMCFYGSRADTGRSMEAHRDSGQHAQRLAYNRTHPDG